MIKGKNHLDLSGMSLAVVGGDEREREIARLAALTGASVRAFGFPWPDGGLEGVTLAPSAALALEGCRFALFPIPGMGTDGSIFGTETIIPNRDLLSLMVSPAHIILGTADSSLKAVAAQLGIHLHEYESDRELMLLRMPAIVEGALKVVIENTDVTIHKARICVVGYGNMGALLTRTLVLLGARVTMAARNPVQRADAHAVGAEPLPLTELSDFAPDFDIVLSTVPAPVVDEAICARLPAHALVVDLSAPPGGVDLAAAKRLGLRAVWARALGRRAPVTVGASQWKGISERIETILEGERN